jgi:MOSC domain-containing protein YiiM
MARLVSVNVGTPTVQPGSSEATGIVKVPRTGPVMIDEMGVVGDAIMDRKHHGGADQAIYLYLQSDYDWWVEELQSPLGPGTFGENFTIAGVEGADLAIGDRFAIGDALIEVTYHRTPCATFARRMRDPKWVKRFHRARRPGAYARVLQAGVVEAGMDADYWPFAGERVTVAELMGHDGEPSLPAHFMRRVLGTPIRLKTRAKYEAALATQSPS